MTTDDDLRPPQQFAAPAPTPNDADTAQDETEDTAGQADDSQPIVHQLCIEWAAWCRSRRLYVNLSMPKSLLERLTSKSSGRSLAGGPDAALSADLTAFHQAYRSQPAEALDRKVFELHYYWGVRNVKAAASAIGIGRQHWYTLVRGFRTRVYRASLDILRDNLAAADRLPSRAVAGSARQDDDGQRI